MAMYGHSYWRAVITLTEAAVHVPAPDLDGRLSHEPGTFQSPLTAYSASSAANAMR